MGTVRIPLANGRGFALVDDADAELVSRYRWRRYVAPHTSYAHANIGRGRARRDVRMHVLITGQRGMDHANGDGLDNRRINLRPATQSQNLANMRPRGGTSRYKGVSWSRQRGKWVAYITGANRPRNLGGFTSETDAARAYDTAAVAAWGEYARPNFPG